jgi:hypothetical protein
MWTMFEPLGVMALISTAAAIVLAGVVWRLASHERRRSAARLAALEMDVPAAIEPGSRRPRADVPRPAVGEAPGGARAEPGASGMFAAVGIGRSAHARPAALIALAGLVVVLIGGALVTRFAGGTAAIASAAPAREPSLELLSLRHVRQGESWTIRGLVRNAPVGAELGTVTAVAFLFDRTGSFLASGRASLEFAKLAPGDESPFTVTVAATGEVARYRLSFRAGDGRLIRHVDRRPTPSVE